MTTHLFLLDEDEREVIDEGDLEEGKKNQRTILLYFKMALRQWKALFSIDHQIGEHYNKRGTKLVF